MTTFDRIYIDREIRFYHAPHLTDRQLRALAEDVVSGDPAAPWRRDNVKCVMRRIPRDRRWRRAYLRAWQRRCAHGTISPDEPPPVIVRFGGYARLPATPPLPFRHRSTHRRGARTGARPAGHR